MGKLNKNVYTPNEQSAAAYDLLFEEYALLHDYFGRGANEVMHRLKSLKRAAVAASVASVAPTVGSEFRNGGVSTPAIRGEEERLAGPLLNSVPAVGISTSSITGNEVPA